MGRAVQREKRKKENNTRVFEESVDSRMIERRRRRRRGGGGGEGRKSGPPFPFQLNVSRVSDSLALAIARLDHEDIEWVEQHEEATSSERSDE
jgi:hypothetical protein